MVEITNYEGFCQLDEQTQAEVCHIALNFKQITVGLNLINTKEFTFRIDVNPSKKTLKYMEKYFLNKGWSEISHEEKPKTHQHILTLSR